MAMATIERMRFIMIFAPEKWCTARLFCLGFRRSLQL
jgi:hypothetical protein